MSQENVDLARRSFEAIQRGDFTVAQEMLAPDAVIVQPPEVPDAKTYFSRASQSRRAGGAGDVQSQTASAGGGTRTPDTRIVIGAGEHENGFLEPKLSL